MNIPYVGQVGQGANEHGSDCGAACACMVIAYAGKPYTTVDAMYNEAKPSGDGYLWISDIMQMLFRRSIDCDYDAPITTDRLVALVRAGNPVIALIDYDELEAIRPNSFNGSHFVVVYDGDDKDIYIHDPLNSPTSGANTKVSRAMWDKAWTNLDDQNPNRGAIIVNLQMVSPAEPPLSEPTSGEYVTTLVNLKVRREPNTNYQELVIAKVGTKFRKAGDPLPGTGIVKAWQQVVVYLGTGVFGDDDPYLE
jgi:hypothetical protein